jgi:hypothetical protein
MKGRIGIRAAVLLAGALLASACGHPKYAHYVSVFGDYKCDVPWGWQIMADHEKNTFTGTNFIGPFEPGFLLGTPSFSVRWHSYNEGHRLPDGQLELYSSVDDYIKQSLRDVYQPHMSLINASHQVDDKTVDGRPAKYFLVSSPVRVPNEAKWGTVLDADTGEPYNVRQHAYVVVPMTRGFYVLIYPATKEGYPLYEKEYDELVHSFKILKDGPDGPPPAPASASAPASTAIPARAKH